VPDRRERLAQNEALFREVNERISELASGWSNGLDLVCECANVGCSAPIRVTVEKYHEVRSHDDRFLIAVGHALPELERVVESSDDYEVVEKHAELIEAI
jgi:hypothetical protein